MKNRKTTTDIARAGEGNTLPRDKSHSPSTQSPGLPHSLESTKSSISPSMRFPLPRALSPDLPTRDALYLFCNFSSYMRSPHEGAEGITNNEDFRDTIRLLDFARVGRKHGSRGSR
jgi:hypothetical protein